MDELLELIKIFGIGAGAGLVFGLLIKGNKYKQEKQKRERLEKNKED